MQSCYPLGNNVLLRSESDHPRRCDARTRSDVDNRELASPIGSEVCLGKAVYASDADLIALLNMPPKATKELRTKSSFLDFFRGMPRQRMVRLLESAYCSLSENDRQLQVQKRLDLLTSVLIS